MIADADHAVLYFLNGLALKSWSFDVLIQLLERNMLVKGGVIVTVYWFLWFHRDAESEVRERRKTLIASVIGTFAGLMITIILTIVLPMRLRPVHDPSLHLLVPNGVETILKGYGSFPSDTATLAGGLTMGIFLVSRRIGIFVLAFVLAMILVPRVYLGLHYPSDILAGILIGAVSVVAAQTSAIRNVFADKLLSLSERYPGWAYALLFFIAYQMGSLFLDLRDIGTTGLMILEKIAHRMV